MRPIPSGPAEPTRIARRYRHRRRLYRRRLWRLILLPAVAVIGLLLTHAKPQINLRASGSTLAQLIARPASTRLLRATARATGWSSELTWRSGALWPQRPVPPSSRVTVAVTMRDASWVGDLPWGRAHSVALRQAPPDPRLDAHTETLLPRIPLLVRLTSDAAAVSVSGPDGPLTSAQPVRDRDDIWSVALPQQLAASGGPVWVRTQALSWEAPSPPQALRWTVAPLGSLLRLQQMLAQLGYLPLAWRPATASSYASCLCALALTHPPAGRFSWRWPTLPTALRRLWSPGTDNVITQGAVITFDRVHGLPILPYATPVMWRDLAVAWEGKQMDPHAYTYVHVSEVLPETVVLWRDGRVALQSPVNTAKPPAHTHLGTFPVHLRLRRQSMRGFGPDGRPYFYPDVPWVNYFQGNDALHGFVRQAYGFPQSAGCVELPLRQAKRLWQLIHYGTLVTVADA